MNIADRLARALPILLVLALSGCPQEVCGDGEDNDGDGDTDCADLYCAAQPECAGDDDSGGADDDAGDDDADDDDAGDDDAGDDDAGDDDADDDDDAADELRFLFADARHSAGGSLDFDVYLYDGGTQSRVAALPLVQEDPVEGPDGAVYFSRQLPGGGSELFSLDPSSGDLAQLTGDAGDGTWTHNEHPAPTPDGEDVWFTSWRTAGGSAIRRLVLATGTVETTIDLGAGTLAGGPRPYDPGDGVLHVLFAGDAGGGDMAVWEWTDATGAQPLGGTDSNGVFDGGPVPMGDGLVAYSRGTEERGGNACAPRVRPGFLLDGVPATDDLGDPPEYVAGRSRLGSVALMGQSVVAGLRVEVQDDSVHGSPIAQLVPTTSAPPVVDTADPLLGHPGPKLIVAGGYALDCCGDPVLGPCDQTFDLRAILGSLQLQDPAVVDWSFGDGGSGLATWTSASHSYTTPGTWQPVAVVTDECGRETVVPAPPVVVVDCAGMTDADGDGSPAGQDCDDADPATAPGMAEACDGADNDCDGEVSDESQDGDGDGSAPCGGDCDDRDPALLSGCEDADGDGVPADEDCDDLDAGSFPGNVESCNGIDDDCDGSIADEDLDLDADGAAPCDGDCDDLDPETGPGAAESCDLTDSDCDGSLVDDFDTDLDSDGIPDCVDDDMDGDGVPGPSAGGDDCDDSDADVAPGLPEVCDGKDNDCVGGIPLDEYDHDGDFYAECISAIANPPFMPEPDCDDTDAQIHPGAPEACNGIDDDCSGAPAADETGDADSDGSVDCEDCDDTDAQVHPGAVEVCNGIDDDCSGAPMLTEADSDGDGTVNCADCGPADATIHPGAVETCNSVDDDCDGFEDEDFDLDIDGWATCAGDCDDGAADTWPGAPESTFVSGTCVDGKDNDCNGDPDCGDPSCQHYIGCVTDDAWEVNDTQPTATPMTTGVYTQGVLCWGSDDWFTAPCLNPGGSANAVIEHFMSPPDALGNFAGSPFDTDNFSYTNPSTTGTATYSWGEVQGTVDLCTWYRMTVNIAGGC